MAVRKNGQELDLTIPQKKAAKKTWPVLEDLDLNDYDVRTFEVHCIRCNGKAYTTAYKIHAENEWKGYEKESVCGDCQVREEMKVNNKWYRKELNERLSSRWWFPPKGLEDATLKGFKQTNTVTSDALYACTQYVKGLVSGEKDKQHNLLLIGTVGAGKSHLSFGMAQYLRSKEIGSVGFTTTGKILALIKETYDRGATRTENEILNDIEKLDCLVIDDLGAEAGNTNEFSWARSKLFEIVNSRAGRPTVYTTNYDDITLPKVVGERVASRLQDNTKYINIFTEDYRKNLQIN
ncbi:ATP-binding protein [Virgibacillus kimchii]